MTDHDPPFDLVPSLRFALAEGESVPAGDDLTTRVLRRALAARRPGSAIQPVTSITGVDTFARMVRYWDSTLAGITGDQWRAPVIRDLTVQQLVGHVIGVEEAFAATLAGERAAGGDDHVESTQATALAQTAVPPAETVRRWEVARDRTARLLAAPDATPAPAEVVAFHTIALPLDELLVVRAFEIWTHAEDIARAVHRPPEDPEPEVVSRMTGLATSLLPVAAARYGAGGAGTVRLVLTGPGGGSWDVTLPSGRASLPSPDIAAIADLHRSAVLTLDAVMFCRTAANRARWESVGATADGDADMGRTLLAATSTLALD